MASYIGLYIMHFIKTVIYRVFRGQKMYRKSLSVAKPYLYRYNVISHPLVYSFIGFKYVNLILWKEKNTLRRIGLYFLGFGEKLI